MITLALAKAHLKVEHSAEDALIQAYLDAAQAWVEGFTGKLLTRRAVVQTATGFGEYLPLWWGPDPVLEAIDYLDADGVEASVAEPRLLRDRIYAPLAGWPAVLDRAPIAVSYTAGFGTGAGQTPLPGDLAQAVLLLVAFHYGNRGDAGGEAPPAVEALCRKFRPVLI